MLQINNLSDFIKSKLIAVFAKLAVISYFQSFQFPNYLTVHLFLAYDYLGVEGIAFLRSLEIAG
jgi:hypothetical protein